MLNTLGAAQFRMAQYQEAAATLERCDQRRKQSDPVDLAFFAMAQYRLGQTQQALATLQRLRQLMKAPAQGKNPDNQAFLKEPEATLAGKKAGRQ
jgi:TolA-binding protein